MSLLDDMCLRPGNVTDAVFLDTLNRNQKIVQHAHYQSRVQRQFLSDTTMKQTDFRLVHYAGDVTYSVEGFIVKNKDSLFQVRFTRIGEYFCVALDAAFPQAWFLTSFGVPLSMYFL